MATDRGVVRSETGMNTKSILPLPPAVELPQVERQTTSFHSPESPHPSSSGRHSPPTSPSKRIQRDHIINRDALSLMLLFNGPDGPSIQNSVDTAPPAFFPQQRVSFSPRLRITNRAGLMLMGRPGAAKHDREHVCSMMLGVTGIVETLGGSGRVKTRRIAADFCTDLSSGVQVWRKDAEAAVARRRAAQGLLPPEMEPDGSGPLPPGTYVLPLSMRIPACDRLPPSYDSKYFRLSYTMTLVLLSRKANAPVDSIPHVVKLVSVPFHILPSTLPSLPPTLPILTHEERKGLGASIRSGLYKSLAMATSTSTDSPTPSTVHVIAPSLPTAHFSPGAIIPLTVSIRSRALAPKSDLYVRLTLVRKMFVRDSPTSLEELNEFDLPLDMLLEPHCTSQEVLVSRWAYIPYEHRVEAARGQQHRHQSADLRLTDSEVVLRDIAIPVGGGAVGWQHGYSTDVNLSPTVRPFLDYAKGSWFAPVVRQVVASHGKDAERYLHVSTRFFVCVDVGFHSPSASCPQRLGDVLAERARAIPGFVVPAPATFTEPVYADVDPWSSDWLSNCSAPEMRASRSTASWERSTSHSLSSTLFGARLSSSAPAPSSRSSSPPPSSSAASSSLSSSAGFKAALHGSMRTLVLPITIGSVAEPTMRCVSGNWAYDMALESRRQSHPADREVFEDTPAEQVDPLGDDGEQSWIVAPPTFSASLEAPPAYL